jgi:hypothetical protein
MDVGNFFPHWLIQLWRSKIDVDKYSVEHQIYVDQFSSYYLAQVDCHRSVTSTILSTCHHFICNKN